MLDLRDYVLDVKKFAEIPKCKGAFRQGESRCLLSAFWQALGFSSPEHGFVYWSHPDCNIKFDTEKMLLISNDLIRNYGLKFEATPEDHVSIRRGAKAIMYTYDSLDPTDALNMVWELIDRHPKKINLVNVSDIVMPEAVCQI